VDQLRKTEEMDANYFPTYRWLAMAYLGKSMPEQALQEAQKAAALSNNSTEAMADLAISYAASSKTKEATSVLRSLEAASRSRYVSSFEISAIFVSLNETNKAFELLQKAYDEHNYNLPTLKVDARFDNLHSDPRFGDLLRRIRLPQ
jgi:hypothetical protein